MKVPEPRRLPSGTWRIQLRLDGKSVSVTASTARDCRRQAELIKAEHRNGKKLEHLRSGTAPTLKQLMENYIARYGPALSPSTRRGYSQMKDGRFKACHDRAVTKIDYQQMVNEELRIVSPKTVKNAWGLVRAALAAEKYPVPDVKLPAVPVKEIPFLQPEEIFPFMDAIAGDIAEIGILLELQGLRRSEVKGLDWSRVDLKNKSIYVHDVRVQDETGVFVTKSTAKNASSVRPVPIMIPQLEKALEAVEDKTGPVVTVAENTLLRHTKEACKAAGVTVVGNHGLRHSFASLGYHLGLTERELMELGGWSDWQTLHKIYVRLATSKKEASKNAISAFFESKNKIAHENAH